MGADSAPVMNVARTVAVVETGIFAPAYVLAMTQHSAFVGFATVKVSS